MWKQLALGLPDLARDMGGLAGAGLLSYGAWLIYQPAGFICAGALMIVGTAYSAIAKG